MNKGYSKRLRTIGAFCFLMLEITWVCSAWGYAGPGLLAMSLTPAVVFLGACFFGYRTSLLAGVILGISNAVNGTIDASGALSNAIFSVTAGGKPVQSLILCFVPSLVLALGACWSFRRARELWHRRLLLAGATVVWNGVYGGLISLFAVLFFPDMVGWDRLLGRWTVSAVLAFLVPAACVLLADWLSTRHIVRTAFGQIDEAVTGITRWRQLLQKAAGACLALFLLLLGVPLLYHSDRNAILEAGLHMDVQTAAKLRWVTERQVVGLLAFVLMVGCLVILAYCYFQNQDKSAKRKIEQEMKRTEFALNEARYANQAKTRFLSNMSHDIRTPMNAIIGYTTIASANMDDRETVRSSLQHIMQASEHLMGLINDVLDMSRIESGRDTLNLSKARMTEVVRSVLPMVQSQIEMKQIELYVDTIDMKHDAVYADTQKMRQILINLLGNAVKFTDDGGSIAIRIKEIQSARPGYAHFNVSVNDNGIGMSKEFAAHIFEPFEQERSSEESGKPGSGLGMSIAKGYVELMGGRITVDSELGKGTRFTVSLDLKLQEDYVPDQRLDRLKGFRALVVDDDFQTCDSVTKMLGEIGMRSDWTMSSREALLRAQKAYNEGDAFFAYVIDWVMPEINGIELVKKIRKIVGNDVPVIVLTAYAWTDVIEEAKRAGVTALCTKPLFIDDLTTIFLNNLDGTEPEMARQEEKKADFSGSRVLLAEDNRMNREIVTFELEAMGLEVHSVGTGADAVDELKKAADWAYDYVLMDVRMPVMDGLEATRCIRAADSEYLKSVPIIALTANAFDQDIQNCLEAGMNVHVSKPFKPDQLARILQAYRRKDRVRQDHRINYLQNLQGEP